MGSSTTPVSVNAVAPGLVATPWTEDWQDLKDGVSLLAPLHRVATPEDIADACLSFVATRYATGQTLLVDGGLGLVL
jgi:ketoreductase RED2